MQVMQRVESELTSLLAQAATGGCPPQLAAAMRYAVFPGGARVRPRMCLAVAVACGEDDPRIADAAAASLELLHCASLVHDDLPCFDDAELRRGRPSVHRSFGERLGVLCGDGLIVLAFEALARAGEHAPARLPALLRIIGAAAGTPSGAVAGQAWECEPDVELAAYHRAKTGALFAACTMAGAAAAGADPQSWRAVGEQLGEAYQVADDLRDVAADAAEIGKPVGRDAALGRPNSVAALGMPGAVARLDELVSGALEVIPECPGAATIRRLIGIEVRRLIPRKLTAHAA